MAHLFISYAREDGKEFAELLEADMHPHDAWLDRSDLSAGMTWTQEIEDAIDRSQAFLAVLTNAYRRSRFARMELDLASGENKLLIPLRVHREAKPMLLLAGVQYIDFTDPAARAASMRALLDRIEMLTKQGDVLAGPSDERAVAKPLQWEAVLAESSKQTRGFISEHEGSTKAPGTFSADLYVRREAAERELDRFLNGPASALILIGDSGVGKTNLLCRWALDLLNNGHAVLSYDCSALADTDIESEMGRDLSISRLDGVHEAVKRIDAEAARAARKLVVIFDSVGDYRGSERNGAQVLLRRINAFVSRLGDHVRIVLSCNAATWNRMERLAPIRLDPDRYFRSADDESFLRLGAFTPEEFANAYTRYHKFFNLSSELEELPPAVQERLREPVLLRMTAEAYRGAEQPLLPVNLALGIYKRYFDERVALPREVWLVDELAEQMMTRKTSALSMTDLARDERLGPEILSEDPSSTYSRLLDRGVLQESSADSRSRFVIRFSHTRVAAYALAMNVLKRSVNVAEAARSLVAGAAEFPLAWEVGKTLLLVSRDQPAFVALAESRDIEPRELAAEALVELHADDPKTACALLETLLDQKSQEARRTALKAAYNIGPQARDFFLRAAIDGDPSMRESVKNTLYLIWRNESAVGRRSVTDTLYLIWRHAPGFTHEFLNSLLGEIGIKSIAKLRSIVEFVLDLTITIYINHCEEKEVIERTAALMHDLTVNRLHLNLLGILGSTGDKIFGEAVARVFSEQILNWMLFADTVPAQTFFDLPKERRACLGRIADVFDPAADLEAAHDDLAAMLQSGTPIFSGSAAMAIAVHASHDIRKAEPLIRRLWDEVGVDGRLWILAGFSVLLKDTPAEWVPLLEELTGRYVAEHRSSFLGESSRLAGNVDIVLLPLGLGYGKRGSSMPLFEKLLQDGLAAGDTPLVSRCIAALGAVGFYYPHAMFEVIRPAMDKLEDREIESALVSTLATVRTLHVDAVDQFLNRTGAPDALRRRINAAADVALVHRYILVLGLYNNAVHFTLYYPRMRKPLSAGALRLLADGRDAKQFIAEYTATAMRMLRESRFQLLEWTLPE